MRASNRRDVTYISRTKVSPGVVECRLQVKSQQVTRCEELALGSEFLQQRWLGTLLLIVVPKNSSCRDPLYRMASQPRFRFRVWSTQQVFVLKQILK